MNHASGLIKPQWRSHLFVLRWATFRYHALPKEYVIKWGQAKNLTDAFLINKRSGRLGLANILGKLESNNEKKIRQKTRKHCYSSAEGVVPLLIMEYKTSDLIKSLTGFGNPWESIHVHIRKTFACCNLVVSVHSFLGHVNEKKGKISHNFAKEFLLDCCKSYVKNISKDIDLIQKWDISNRWGNLVIRCFIQIWKLVLYLCTEQTRLDYIIEPMDLLRLTSWEIIWS